MNQLVTFQRLNAIFIALGCLGVLLAPKLLAADSNSISLIFKDHGSLVRELNLVELEKLVPSRSIEVIEPHIDQKVQYVGFPARELLKAIYGDKWTKMEELLLTCTDGYQPNIAARQFQESQAFFAFKKADGSEFKIPNKQQDSKVVPLGPFYLVWENIKDETMKEDGGSSWPYQVTTVDSINFSEKYPHLAPPSPTSANVQDGFFIFRKRCFSCHTINGEGGGASGIELNYPMNVTEYYKEGWLQKFISQPKDVRWQSPMPPFSMTAKNRDAQIDKVVAYLKAMVTRKSRPTASRN